MSSATILLLPILLNFIPLCVTALAASDSAPCNSSCGNITNISFPFILNNSLSGVDPSFCPSSSYMDNPNFQLFCDHAEDKLYALYQSNDSTTLEVISIHNDSLIVGFANSTANMLAVSGESYCNESETSGLSLPAEYTISDENMFGSFGCTIGVLSTSNLDYDHVENGGCSVLLPENRNNTKCGNRTCCVASLPSASDGGLQYAYYFTTYTPYPYDGLSVNITSLPECLMCSDNYATLFHPDFTDFDTPDFRIKVMWALPVVMNYNASDLLFEKELNQTIVNSPEYACTWDGSSDFIAVPEMQGYRCKCKDGFVGDGYANGTGCTNVDECAISAPCVSHAKCKDTLGSYICDCNSRFKLRVGDGRKDGSGCKLSPWIYIFLPASLGLVIIILIIIILLTYGVKMMKRKNFIQNGGVQLQDFMSSKGYDDALPKMFTSSELKVATNNYADNMKIGSGGFGVVYKGKLETGKLVAIKKEIIPRDGDNKEFFNEVIILTQIRHKHIVKLLGCCLETKTPLLVFEYASNGTLAEHLREAANKSYVMGWEERLNVAIQIAEALSYLHRATSPPILHRDVKSTNILLDDHWNAKVGDFGVSRLVPDGEKHISTVVQGTLGYLDPEYFQTLQLTDKSDVYSMGVILVELITSLKPVDAHRHDPQFSNLALLFIHHMKEGRLDEIIDPRLLEIVEHSVSISPERHWRLRSSVLGVASIAHRCLALIGNDRPSMMEVERLLHEISCKLHSPRIEDMDDGIFALPQPCVTSALTTENNKSIINSSEFSLSSSISQNYGTSTHLLR